MSSIKFILSNVDVDLWHRRKMRALCLLHKMYYNDRHPLHLSLPGLAIFSRYTRQAATANSVTFSGVRFNTNQFARSFIVATTRVWNSLPSAVVESVNLQSFKKEVNAYFLSSSST